MEAKQVLEIALTSGHMLLSNGAEAYRIEETIERICSSYNLECECMTTARGVFVSVLDKNGERITSLKKIRTRSVDLYRIELINSFSRNIQNEQISYEEANNILKDIEAAPHFRFPIRLFAASMTSFVYSLFFNGTLYDSIVSAVVSIGIYFMLEKISHIGFFQFFQFFFSSFIIGCASLIAENIIPSVNKGHVIIGSIMILLPGVALTNGIKDIIYGDFESGIVKFGEAMLVITSIGVGIGSALALGMGVRL